MSLSAAPRIAGLFLCLVFWASAFGQDLAAVPPFSAPVVDTTGTLSRDQLAQLTGKLSALQTRKGSQVAVLIVPSTKPEAIEQYSLRVAEEWKVGRKKVDDGALLVVAKDDRQLRIRYWDCRENPNNSIITTESGTSQFPDFDFVPNDSDVSTDAAVKKAGKK